MQPVPSGIAHIADDTLTTESVVSWAKTRDICGPREQNSRSFLADRFCDLTFDLGMHTAKVKLSPLPFGRPPIIRRMLSDFHFPGSLLFILGYIFAISFYFIPLLEFASCILSCMQYC